VPFQYCVNVALVDRHDLIWSLWAVIYIYTPKRTHCSRICMCVCMYIYIYIYIYKHTRIYNVLFIILNYSVFNCDIPFGLLISWYPKSSLSLPPHRFSRPMVDTVLCMVCDNLNSTCHVTVSSCWSIRHTYIHTYTEEDGRVSGPVRSAISFNGLVYSTPWHPNSLLPGHVLRQRTISCSVSNPLPKAT